MVFSGVMMTGPTVGRHVEIAKEAERIGLETAWMAEVSGPDAITVLAASATATTRIKLSTGIIATALRDPFLAAMTFHSLQDLSDGRMMAGFGTSTPAIVTGWHGIPFPKPIASTRAFVDIVRRLLAGERVKSEGEYTLRGAVLRGPAKAPVPIYLAALNEKMLELAGEIADGVILNFPTLGYTKRALAAIDRGLARGGRERAAIDIVANFRTGIGDFDAIAAPLRRELITYFMAPVYQKVFRADGWGDEVDRVTGLWAAGDRAGAIAAIPDEFVAAHGAIASDAAGCASIVQGHLALGVDRAALFPVIPDGTGFDQFLGTMRAFAS